MRYGTSPPECGWMARWEEARRRRPLPRGRIFTLHGFDVWFYDIWQAEKLALIKRLAAKKCNPVLGVGGIHKNPVSRILACSFHPSDHPTSHVWCGWPCRPNHIQEVGSFTWGTMIPGNDARCCHGEKEMQTPRFWAFG